MNINLKEEEIKLEEEYWEKVIFRICGPTLLRHFEIGSFFVSVAHTLMRKSHQEHTPFCLLTHGQVASFSSLSEPERSLHRRRLRLTYSNRVGVQIKLHQHCSVTFVVTNNFTWYHLLASAKEWYSAKELSAYFKPGMSLVIMNTHFNIKYYMSR